MQEGTLKLKKGGLDTIVAYIVVMIPLLYVVVYMIATIYHFSVQQYLSQVLKETCVMASTYGDLTTTQIDGYLKPKLCKVFKTDKNDGEKESPRCEIYYYIKRFEEDNGTFGELLGPFKTIPVDIQKADIIGIYVESVDASILGSVSTFNLFKPNASSSALKYSAYREEIIRNERAYNPESGKTE